MGCVLFSKYQFILIIIGGSVILRVRIKVIAMERYLLRQCVPLICFVLFLSLVGCRFLFNFPTYYDAITYKNLTELKPRVEFLYDKFTSEEIPREEIESIRLRLAQVYEYEKGKGVKNLETYQQVHKIQGMFDRHVLDRKRDGPWSREHMENKKDLIMAAFDIAIVTERKKNKNE